MAYQIEKRENGCLVFTISRKEKRNAINYDVMEGLTFALQRAEESDIKALAITGAGDRAFCSGGDLSVFHLLRTREEAFSMLSKMADILYSLATLLKPTVALLNGTTIGGGCELASACDFRLAQKGIKAGFIQGKQAITTGWGGGTLLGERVPSPIAMKLLMDAELQTAEFLYEAGFINALYENDSMIACDAFLDKMLTNDLEVLKAYKKMWIRKWEVSNLRERMESEVDYCAALWESEAHLEHVKNFLSKKNSK